MRTRCSLRPSRRSPNASRNCWLPEPCACRRASGCRSPPRCAELSEDEAEDTADRLVHSSLLRVTDRERRRFQLHALLREQVRARQDGDGLGKLQERHAAVLERIFQAWNVAQDQKTRWQ